MAAGPALCRTVSVRGRLPILTLTHFTGGLGSKDTEQQGFIALSLLGDDAIRVSTAPGNLLEFDIPPGNT